MKLLDTREQKSPQYIFDGIPNVSELQLDTYDYIDVDDDRGFGAELKHEDFNLKATDTIEQFEHELAKMARHHQAHPHIYPHAIWNKSHIWDREINFVWIEKYHQMRSQIAVFMSMCQDYGVKGHVVESNKQTIALLRRLKHWYPKEDYIKKRRTKHSILADMLAAFPGISSAKAIALAEALNCSWMEMFYSESNDRVREDIQETIIDTIGRKKNGEPKKLANDLIYWIETGEKL